MAFKRELTALQKDLNRIGQKLEKLIAAIGKGEAKTAKVSKGKAIRAAAKKAPAKTASGGKRARNLITSNTKGLQPGA